jgi:hypothetical protein
MVHLVLQEKKVPQVMQEGQAYLELLEILPVIKDRTVCRDPMVKLECKAH